MDEDNDIAEQGMKRKSSTQVSTLPTKSAKYEVLSNPEANTRDALASWQIGEPTPNEGTVMCPVKYSKISEHLKLKTQ